MPEEVSSKEPETIQMARGKRGVASRGKSLVSGFRYFISDYGVAPLAVGVVIGTAVNDLVKTLVDGLISPFIALISPNQQLQTFQLTFHGSVFKIGVVANSLISFIVICLVVYLAVKLVLRNEDLLKKK